MQTIIGYHNQKVGDNKHVIVFVIYFVTICISKYPGSYILSTNT
jgi:hypothetical protein